MTVLVQMQARNVQVVIALDLFRQQRFSCGGRQRAIRYRTWGVTQNLAAIIALDDYLEVGIKAMRGDFGSFNEWLAWNQIKYPDSPYLQALSC